MNSAASSGVDNSWGPVGPGSGSSDEARFVAEDFDVSSQSFGQQQSRGGIATVRRRADNQRFRSEDVTVDFVGSGQGCCAREPGVDENALSIVGHPDGIHVCGGSMRLDHNSSPVFELHAPDNVDSSGAELNTRDGAAKPVCCPAVEESVQLERRHGTVDGGFGAAHRGSLGLTKGMSRGSHATKHARSDGLGGSSTPHWSCRRSSVSRLRRARERGVGRIQRAVADFLDRLVPVDDALKTA